MTTTHDIAEAAEDMKAEIREDITDGLIPTTVRTYSDLHDHRDANEYGGFTDPARRAAWSTSDLIAAQDIVDAWLAAGRP